MSIVERIRRIARANVHQLLDKVDTPEQALRGRIEELEEAVREARQALAGLGVTHRRLRVEQEQLEHLQAQRQLEAESALQRGDEAAARRALSSRIQTEQRTARLRPSVAKTGESYRELKAELVALSDQLKAARMKLSELESRKQAAAAQKTVAERMEQAKGSALGEVDFGKLEEDVLQAETEAEIEREIRREMAGIDAELDAAETDSRVTAELDALKHRVKGA